FERLAAAKLASPTGYYYLGIARSRFGDYKAARVALSAAVQAGRKDGPIYYLLGSACAGEGQWQDAVDHYSEALRYEDAPNAEVWRARGEAYARLQRWANAAADFESLGKARILQPDDRYALALLRLRTGDLKAYQDLCRSWLKRLEKPPRGVTIAPAE